MRSSEPAARQVRVLLGTFSLTTEAETMKRYRFLCAVESGLEELRQSIRGKGLMAHEVDAVVSDVVAGIFARKAYGKMTPKNALPFLKKTAMWEVAKRRRESAAHAARFVALADPSDAPSYAELVLQEKEMSEDECPFCYVGILNVYGACAKCHTVVGKRHVPGPAQPRLSDIASDEDVELTAEVRIALGKLPIEQQKLLVRVACGGDTVGDLTTEGGTSMWRKYVAAKHALRELLKDYAPKGGARHD